MNLKKSFIQSIFKQGCHYDYSNYRSIAIFSIINKLVEKIIVGQICSFLEEHGGLSDAQHGFRSGRGTSTALSNFTDGGNQVVCIFIVYKKTFDTLDLDILLKAMDECGIRGPINN